MSLIPRTLAASLAIALPTLMGTTALSAAESDSTLSRVIVYQNGGAMLHRTAETASRKGETVLTFTGLPDAVGSDAIRQILSPGGQAIPFASVVAKTRYVLTSSREEVQDLEADLKAREKELAVAAFTEDRLTLQVNALSKMDISDDPDKKLAYIDDQVAKRHQDLLRVRTQIEDLEADVARILDQIKAVSDDEKAVVDVTVRLTEPLAQTVLPTLVYESERASWFRALEARLDSQTGEATLAQRAVIAQTTGEDWPVKIVELGNSRARANGQSFNPTSRFLTVVDPKEKRRGLAGTANMAAASPMLDQDRSPREGMRATRLRNEGLESRILLDQDGVIPASGTEVQLPLFDTNIKGAVFARVMPDRRTTPTLILEAKLPKDWSTESWMRTRIWRDGALLGETNWEPLEGGQMNRMPFGTIPGLDVDRRNLGATETGRRGENGERGEGIRVQYSATNTLPVPITLDVVTVTPIAGHEDITVTTPGGMTKPTITQWMGEKGVVLWRKRLTPGESWTINHGYDIRYPAALSLQTKRN